MQENVWEKEYRDPKLISLDNKPIKAVVRFYKYFKKEYGYSFSNKSILDLGCGNGKNSIYLSLQGDNNTLHGIDISETAIEYAKKDAEINNINANFIKYNFGNALPYSDNSFDIILDITSSNSLSESERGIYLKEISRIAKPDCLLFIRALCKDGDKNAKELLETNPGKEKDTYIMPELGLIERVFTRQDLLNTYSGFGENVYLDRESHYTKFNNRLYKREFFIGYWKKKML